jgi:hypothetical protein
MDKNNFRAHQFCLTESEMIRGKNGIAIFDEWYRPEEPDNCSRGDIAKACRLEKVY